MSDAQDREREELTSTPSGVDEDALALVEANIRAQRMQFSSGLSKYMTIGSVVAAGSPMILWLFLQEYPQLLGAAVIIAPMIVGWGSIPFFYRRNQPEIGHYLALISLLIASSFAPLLIPSAFPAAVVACVINVVMGYVLLGARRGGWLAGISVLVFATDIIVLNVWKHDWFTPLDETIAAVVGVAVGLAAYVTTIQVARLIVFGQEKATRQAQLAHIEVEKQVEERTAELRYETAERERLQQEVIEAQRKSIRELSSPVIPIMEGVIVMPLIGNVDTQRARDTTRALLDGITQHHAKVAILDVTGVPIVDTGIAQHLDKTIQAARLKGTHTIVTGISNAVAEAIVDLGIDWSRMRTLRDLQSGLVAALDSMGIKLSR